MITSTANQKIKRLVNLQKKRKLRDTEGVFLVEGPRVERMLGYTNLESEKGFAFFQNFLKENGILEELENLGIEEGDTVKLYNLEFEYYR